MGLLYVKWWYQTNDQRWWNGWFEPPAWSLMGFVLDSRYMRMHNI